MGWQEFPIRHGHAQDATGMDQWYIYGAIPTASGYATEHAFTASGTGTMVGGGGVNSCAELFTTNGTRRVMFGSVQKLWSWDGVIANATVERSGTTCGATTAQNWSFAQFGDNTLAACKAIRLQRWTGTGNFADAASNAPKASIVVNAGFPSAPQVMVFDYDDGTDYPDGWYCSALSTDTSWTVNYASGCANGRLLEPTGPITAAVPFRDGVVAFKRNAMYYGEYSPDGVNVIQWRRLSSAIGCLGKYAVVNAEDTLYFANESGFYKFDGSYPVKLPGYVHKEFAEFWLIGYGVLTTYLKHRLCATYSPSKNVVRWTIDTGGDNAIVGFVYHTQSGLWTQWKVSVGGGGSQTSNSGTVWGGYEYCAGYDGSARKQDSSLRTKCYVSTPRIGSTQLGATIRGVWPQWKQVQYKTLGPQRSGWLVDNSQSCDLNAYRAPEDGTATSTVNAAGHNDGYAYGMISGRWVNATMEIYMSGYDWEFSSIALDIVRTQQF